MNSGAPKLTISIDVELAPDLRKYTNSGQEMLTEKEIIVKEQSLEHEFVTNNIEYSEMQYLPGMSNGEGCYDETRQLYMQQMQR